MNRELPVVAPPEESSSLPDPVFVRLTKALGRRTLLRRIALTAVSLVAVTAGQWTFAKPMLVLGVSCEPCNGPCSFCASYIAECPSPTGACTCYNGACSCPAWETDLTPCATPYFAVVVLACEFPCGCQTTCTAC
jgi:hypothetical protein